MAEVNIRQIKKLRDLTQAGVGDCRQALEESNADFKKAQVWLQKKSLCSAAKRAERSTCQGVVVSYSHNRGQIVAVVELLSETDFVSRTTEFQDLAHELAMQVAAMNPQNVEKLLKQPYIRDEKKTVKELVSALIAKTGENIKVNRLARIALGES